MFRSRFQLLPARALISAIFTEIIQFFLIWFGLFLVSILGIVEIGSVQEILNRIPESFATRWSTSGYPTQNGMMITRAGMVLVALNIYFW